MDTELSPLDQIRKTEAAIARQIATAQEKNKQKIAQSRRDAQELLRNAREKGRQQGLERGKEILAKTEEEAITIIEQANKQSEIYRTRGQEQMGEAVHYAVEFILGFEGENEEK